MKFSPDSQVEVPDTTLFQELDDECVLLNLSNESYYGLNDTGTRMWNALTQMDSIEKAFTLLLEEFDVAEEQLRSDLNQFIDELLDCQILKISGS